MKILKSNLLTVPFPLIDAKCDQEMEKLVDEILAGKTEKDELIQKIIYDCFGLDENEIGIVEEYQIRTTGLAGGLHQPYKGMLPACPKKGL